MLNLLLFAGTRGRCESNIGSAVRHFRKSCPASCNPILFRTFNNCSAFRADFARNIGA